MIIEMMGECEGGWEVIPSMAPLRVSSGQVVSPLRDILKGR